MIYFDLLGSYFAHICLITLYMYPVISILYFRNLPVSCLCLHFHIVYVNYVLDEGKLNSTRKFKMNTFDSYCMCCIATTFWPMYMDIMHLNTNKFGICLCKYICFYIYICMYFKISHLNLSTTNINLYTQT